NSGPKLSFLGIRGFDAGALTDQDMEALRAEIESAGILFDVDSSLFTAAQMRAGKTLAAKSRQWVDYANGIGRAARLKVFGYADPTGKSERNKALSRERAERLADLLIMMGISPEYLSVEGHLESTDTVDPALQRRAVIRLTLGPGSVR